MKNYEKFSKYYLFVFYLKMNSNKLVIKGSNYYAQGNYRRAIECLEPAAEQNNTDAMIILGNFFITDMVLNKIMIQRKVIMKER